MGARGLGAVYRPGKGRSGGGQGPRPAPPQVCGQEGCQAGRSPACGRDVWGIKTRNRRGATHLHNDSARYLLRLSSAPSSAALERPEETSRTRVCWCHQCGWVSGDLEQTSGQAARLTPRRLFQPRDRLRSRSWRGSLSSWLAASPRPVSVGLLFPVTVHRSLLFGSGCPASEGRSVRRASWHPSLWLPPRFTSATDHALSFCTVGNHMGEAIQGPTQSVAQSCGQ